jgi:hypothetical protein
MPLTTRLYFFAATGTYLDQQGHISRLLLFGREEKINARNFSIFLVRSSNFDRTKQNI